MSAGRELLAMRAAFAHLARAQLAGDLHERIADDVAAIKRGRVWCKRCGAELEVNGARCLRDGWPTCCGETMTIDSPAEQADLVAKR